MSALGLIMHFFYMGIAILIFALCLAGLAWATDCEWLLEFSSHSLNAGLNLITSAILGRLIVWLWA